MDTLLHIFLILLFAYLALITGYLFVVSLAGNLFKRKIPAVVPGYKRIAVLITTYREDDVILHTAAAACSHNYPTDRYRVFIAAHDLKPATLRQLKTLDLDLHIVNFEQGSKARSLNYLLNRIDEHRYDIALVLDGDNIMQPGFLEKINQAFLTGAKAIQGHRTAKNRNTPVARLDALSEEINNHLFRKSPRTIGLSASLIGSGMAFEFPILKRIYNKPGILDNPACDREVDFEIMKAGIPVEYLSHALVLDEKVARQDVFRNQRRRWLESQLFHLQLFFSEKVVTKTKDYWNKLFITLIPPRVLLLGIFFLVLLLVVVQQWLQINLIGISPCWWAALALTYVVTLVISVPRQLFNRQTAAALFHIPSLLLAYLKAAFGIKTRRKEFVHTPKSYTGKSDPPTP